MPAPPFRPTPDQDPRVIQPPKPKSITRGEDIIAPGTPGYVGAVKGLPTGHSRAVQTVARVDAGRWIVDCPFLRRDGLACNSAQITPEGDKRFWCVDCGNWAVGGASIPVTWPTDPRAIEARLLVRPSADNMAWSPGETLADLEAENAAHGVTPKGGA